MVHKLAKNVFVNRRILYSGVGENEGVRIEPLTGIFRCVGDEITVLVSVA